ncbi:MAG: L,D-transpeptidase [Nitrospiraceae bacterium]
MLRSFAALILLFAAGCLQTPPPELVQDVEALDHELHEIGVAEFAPDEYNEFLEHWVALKTRLEEEDDLIRLPWEPNRMANEVARVADHARKTLSLTKERREAQRTAASAQLDIANERLAALKHHVDAIGGHAVIGQQLLEAEMLVQQAKSYYDHARYTRAQEQAHVVTQSLGVQTVKLTRELSRYADEEKVAAWQAMAQHTVEWSRRAKAYAIVVDKSARNLQLYRNGKPMTSIPIRLGADGVLEKRLPGDGATPEGYYHIVQKRGPERTTLHRALVLDYPNGEDRRSFGLSRPLNTRRAKEDTATMVAIHGEDDGGLHQALGSLIVDNLQIDALYRDIETGTPVTIVGALDSDNPVSRVLPELAEFAADVE